MAQPSLKAPTSVEGTKSPSKYSDSGVGFMKTGGKNAPIPGVGADRADMSGNK